MGMVSRFLPRLAARALLLAWLPGMNLFASCIPLPDAMLRPLDERIIVNPVSVIEDARAELARSAAADVERRASLQAILSESYYQVERDAEAHEAASIGLGYVAQRPTSDLLKARLLLARIMPMDSAVDVEAGVKESTQILDTLEPGSLPFACGLLARARMYQAQNRLDLAVADALNMYRLTGANHWAEAHALAAEAFGSFYADTGDLDEARRFLNESIAYAKSLNATNWLSVAHYFLGRLDLRAGRYDDAVAEMRESSALSAAVGDQRSVSMSKVVVCLALTRSGRLREAKGPCEAADRELHNTDRIDLAKSAMAARADLDLASGDAVHALERLNKVLDHEGVDIEPRTVPLHYLSRARALAKLGQYPLAYQDLARYTELNDAANAADRRRAIAMLRTRFETERAVERSRALQRENDEQRELLARRAEVNRLWTAVALVGAVVIGLLIYLLRTRQRHAQVLEAQAMILHSMNEGVMVLEAGGALRCVNAALEKAFGYAADEFRGLTLQTLGIDADPRLGTVPATLECLLRRKDGSEFPGLVAFTSLAPDNRGQHICVIQDITERKRLERALLDVSMREQRHLGQELHDGLGQELTGLALLARGLAGEARRQSLPNAEDLENLSQIASRAIETCRGMARGLSPAGEVQGGLLQAVQDLTTRVAKAHGAEVTFQHAMDAPLMLTPEASDHVYRIAQEALNNAVKHSGAAHIEVELDVGPAKARLSILDDGHGIGPQASVSHGLGLRTMRYRASLIGGRFSIGVGPSGGTLVVCEWPQVQVK
jgi:PAS domain S-box-containing protein